jgi:hypothetical protein
MNLNKQLELERKRKEFIRLSKMEFYNLTKKGKTRRINTMFNYCFYERTVAYKMYIDYLGGKHTMEEIDAIWKQVQKEVLEGKV